VREFGRSLQHQPARAMGKFDELSLQAGDKAIALLTEKEVDKDTDDGKWLLGELFLKSGDRTRAWHYLRGIKDGKRLKIAVSQMTDKPDLNVSESIAIITEYLDKERPDRITWEIKLADLYLKDRDYKKAEKTLIALFDKKVPQAQLELARFRLQQAKSPAQAKELIENQKKNWPDSLKIEGEFTVCQCLLVMGDWTQAVKKCTDLAEGRYPSEIKQRALYNLGEIKLAENNVEEALKYYGKAARLNEEGTYANDALSRILLISQAKTDKMNTSEMLARALSCQLKGEAAKAEDEYMILADSARGTMAGDLALSELAEMQMARGSYKQVAILLSKLAESSSDSLTAAKAWYQMGRVHYNQLGQKKTGMECWRTGILKYPNTAWAEMMRQEMESGQAQQENN